MNMVQRKFYFPIEMYQRLERLARVQKQTITETVRELLREGLERKGQDGTRNGAALLLELAQQAEREGWHGPTDLSERHDEYFVKVWEEEAGKRQEQV
jgi:hypothetical protein